MSPAERIQRISVRQSARRARERAGLPRRRYRCSACDAEGHRRDRCEVRDLFLWTNGEDFVVAKSAARAAQIWNDPISDDFADLRSSESQWEMVIERLPVFYLLGEPKKQSLRAWIRMFGSEGLFAGADRALDPERSWEL